VRAGPGHSPVRAGEYARRIRRGETYHIQFDESRRYRSRAPERPGIGYRVVHRDADVVVVDKEAEVLSVPTRLRDEESLVDRILASEQERGVRRASLRAVHRLDRDTSGLLVFAKSGRAYASLREQFAGRTIDRRYVAVVEGSVEPAEGRFTSRLVEDKRTLRVRSTKRPDEGREAITEYRVSDRLPEATVLSVRLRTGRKNQIRVHCAEAGHPLVGDRRYGRPSPFIRRAALHACSLGFRHPATDRVMSFESPWPPDLRDLVRRLRVRSR
jgi:23S rRNA pseudouridine1911/1915/1917 synthase